jgi:hypothetical protein
MVWKNVMAAHQLRHAVACLALSAVVDTRVTTGRMLIIESFQQKAVGVTPRALAGKTVHKRNDPAAVSFPAARRQQRSREKKKLSFPLSTTTETRRRHLPGECAFKVGAVAQHRTYRT